MSKIEKLLEQIIVMLATISAVLIASITVLIFINMVLRNLNYSVFYGSLEMIEYALLFSTFLGAPYVLFKHSHISVDLLTNSLPTAMEKVVSRLTYIIGMIVCLLMTWYGAVAVKQSIDRGSTIRTSIVIDEWIILIVIPFSLLLCALVFLHHLIKGPVNQERQVMEI